MYLKLIYFLHRSLILFLEKNYKKETQNALSNSFISVTYSLFILELNFKKSLNLNLKNVGLPYWTRINYMIYWALARKTFELPNWTRIDFILCWSLA